MPSAHGTKINHLLQQWPRGTVATNPWLKSHRVSSDLARWYVRAGWLTRVGPGAYAQAGDTIDWTGGLFALQAQLGMTVHAGAKSALELQGRAHYVPLGSRKRVILISDVSETLPTWFRTHPWDAQIEHHSLKLFERIPPESSRQIDFGSFNVTASSPERAIMEEMRLVRTNDDIEHSIQLLENLVTLRPTIVQQLLEACTSIKVKRLFLWGAEQIGHTWFELLTPGSVDLGAGKRQLYKGGEFDPKYRITVPRGEELPDV